MGVKRSFRGGEKNFQKKFLGGQKIFRGVK